MKDKFVQVHTINGTVNVNVGNVASTRVIGSFLTLYYTGGGGVKLDMGDNFKAQYAEKDITGN